MRLLRLFPLWLVTFLISSSAVAGVVWRGDFETGNLSQYSGSQMVSSDRLQVVSSPVGEGRYVLKATVKQGDDPINSSGNRNELYYQGRETLGSEYYYRWRVMFAPDFPTVKTWQVFTQWHHDGCCGSPPVEFFVYGEEIRLTLTDSVTPWSTKLTRGVWHEFVFHVKWSADPTVGFVELWHNREKVLAKRTLATNYAGSSKVYLKLGLYRSDSVTQTGVVYHDGFMQATQQVDVLPPPPAPDVGTPTPTPTPDSSTPPSSEAPGTPTPAPGSTMPPVTSPAAGEPGTGGSEVAQQYGCSVGSSPMAALAPALALLALFGVLRPRRQR